MIVTSTLPEAAAPARSAPKRLLLAGSRGCLGRAIQAYMRREHPEVQVVPLAPFPFSLQAVGEALRSGGYTHFINAAGRGSDAVSMDEPYPYFDTNAAGVVKHLELIRQHSPATRYLNLGTVYETDPARRSPYVASKRMARQAVTSYRENHGLYAVTATLDFTEYYGRPESCLARRICRGVAAIAKAILAGQSFEPLVLRDLDQRYRWTWAEDVADGMWRMLGQEFAADHALAASENHTVRSFVERAFVAASIPAVWWGDPLAEEYLLGDGRGLATKAYRPLVQATPSRQSKPMTYHPADATAAREQLGWQPKVSFDELIQRMVAHDLAAITGEERVAT